jgi:hypothetical protein
MEEEIYDDMSRELKPHLNSRLGTLRFMENGTTTAFYQPSW